MEPLTSRRLFLQRASVRGLGLLLLGTHGAFHAAFAQSLQPLNPKLTGDLYPIHDPCVIKEGDTFYLFCTTPRADAPAQIPWFHSKDLLEWRRGGHVFSEIPEWARRAVPRTHECWAPDISLFNGRFWLYYACSTFGSNRSVIGLASSRTLNPAAEGFGWEDHGLVLESQNSDDFNAIDPNRVIERNGERQWLAFGSFWSGLEMVPIDPQTGKPSTDAPRTRIARRPKPPDAIEGVFIIQRAGHYFLFASFDFCCKGAQSNYYTVVGRSTDPQGPYFDKSGKPMLDGGGTPILVDGAQTRWRGPGHIAVLRDDARDYLFYHAYDADHDGRPTLRIAPLGWTADDWPVAFV